MIVASKSNKQKIFFQVAVLKVSTEITGSGSDPLVKGMDPGIRTKMSRIRNNAEKVHLIFYTILKIC
jgi:hypothetical protein